MFHRVTIELLSLRPELEPQQGSFLASVPDPELSLQARVISAEPDAPCDVGEVYSFGLRDPQAIGLAHWSPGDSLDIGLLRSEDSSEGSWRVVGVPPN